MTPADLFRKLSALGLTNDQLAGVMDVVGEIEEERKEKTRTRVANWRARNKAETLSNVTERYVAYQNVTDARAHVEDKPSNIEISGKKEGKKTPRDELAAVLDAEHVEAVLEHRQKLRKPLTAYAAKQLASSLAQCPDPNAAADEMVESGWLKVKPEWLAERKRAHSPPNDPFSALETVFKAKGWTDEPSSPHRNHENAQRVPPDGAEHNGTVVDLRRGPGGHFGPSDLRDGEAIPPQQNRRAEH